MGPPSPFIAHLRPRPLIRPRVGRRMAPAARPRALLLAGLLCLTLCLATATTDDPAELRQYVCRKQNVVSGQRMLLWVGLCNGSPSQTHHAGSAAAHARTSFACSLFPPRPKPSPSLPAPSPPPPQDPPPS